MITYRSKLQNIPDSTNFTQVLVANTTPLTFHFIWRTEIEEIYIEYAKALDARAKADPLWLNGEIHKNYDWLNFYMNLPHGSVQELQEYLEATPYIPDSLKNLYNESTSLFYTQMYERCQEADILDYELTPYRNQLTWNVEITDSEGNSVSGVVRSGGWLNEQDPKWRVQFLADKAIGRNDLTELTIRVEVADDNN